MRLQHYQIQNSLARALKLLNLLLYPSFLRCLQWLKIAAERIEHKLLSLT